MAGVSGVSRVARSLITFYLRLALGIDFLSAVADRFGLWGPPGSDHVAWGSFSKYVAYMAQMDVFTPARTDYLIAWIVTAAEILLGVCLILGLFTRIAATFSGIILALIAIGMSVGIGAKSAFDSSAFAASAGAFALVALGPGAWSFDARRRKHKAPPPPPAVPRASGSESGQNKQATGN